MAANRKLGLWSVNVVLVLAVVLALWLQRPQEPLQRGGDGIPDVGGFSHLMQGRVGHDLPLDLFESQLFEGGVSVKREYRGADNTGEPLWLLAVQTFEDRHAHHPPEYCYTGSGWTVESSAVADWELAPGVSPMEAVVSHPDSGARERVVYWFTDGERFVDSYFKRVLMDAWDRITGGRRSWVMMRVSVPEDGQAAGDTGQALREFARAVQADLAASIRAD
ncbi:MAG: exosortase C-terminal domain/associated protein EpsI [Gammaproteobacteria bacterium]